MPIAVALLIWPLVEIALFVTLGGWLGLWLTLAIVLGTAIGGIALMRCRGMRAMADLRKQVASMQNPLSQMADQAVFMLAAMLLILPGFFTDFLGLLLLLPPVRFALIALAARRVVVSPRAPGYQPAQQTDVIDGDYTAINPDADRLRRPSGWTQD
jgi:UPF0716 protein FxsA